MTGSDGRVMQSVDVREVLRFFFRADGRIGRMEYVLGVAFIYAISAAVLLFALAHTDFATTGLLLVTITGLVPSVAFLVLAAKRCHDIALPGSFVLLLVVPVVGLFWLLVLMFIPGNAGPNLYGAPPRFDPD